MLSGFFSGPAQSEAIGTIRRYLGSLPAPAIVLLDELDRADEDELRQATKVLRGFPEIPNLRFVCALDPAVVGRALCGPNATAERAEQIEKFFAVQFRLPGAAAEILQTRCRRQIAGALAGYNAAPGTTVESDLQNRWELYRRVFTTPRRVEVIAQTLTALVNACESSRRLHGLNGTDLLNLACLVVVDPGALSAVEGAPDYFANQGWTQSLEEAIVLAFARLGEWRQRTWDYFRARFDENGKESPGTRVLGELFPEVESWRTADSNTPGAQTSYPGEEDARAGRRIYHPRFLQRYLALAVPGSQYPEDEFDELWAGLATATENEARQLVATALKAQSDHPTKRDDLFDQLLDRLSGEPSLPPPALRGVGLAVLAGAPWEDRYPILGGLRLGLGIVLRIAAALGPGARQFLLAAVREAQNDQTAGLIIDTALSKESRMRIDGAEACAEELRAALAGRLGARFAPGGEALLDLPMEPALRSLSLWMNCGPKAVEDVGALIRRETLDGPARIGRLLGWLARSSGGTLSDRLLAIGIEPRGLMEDAGRLGEEAVTSDEAERRALERLRREVNPPEAEAEAANPAEQ